MLTSTRYIKLLLIPALLLFLSACFDSDNSGSVTATSDVSKASSQDQCKNESSRFGYSGASAEPCISDLPDTDGRPRTTQSPIIAPGSGAADDSGAAGGSGATDGSGTADDSGTTGGSDTTDGSGTADDPGTSDGSDTSDVSAPAYHPSITYVAYDFWNWGWGLPSAEFWYLGDQQWELMTEYSCESFTEMSRNESSIFLSNAAGSETLEVNVVDKTVTSDQNTEILEVLELGDLERPESNVTCPSTSNDHTPVMVSASIAEVNSGRTLVFGLEARDADLPPEDLYFSLTDNAATDNHLFHISNFSETTRAACRAGLNNEGNPTDPNNSKYFIVQDGVSSLEECQAACNNYPMFGSSSEMSCRGVEFRAEGADPTDTSARCELWKTRIVDTAPQPAYACYTRESERPSVLSFVNAPDFRIPLDADVDNVYQAEVSVSDGVGGNSSTQTILVWVIPPGDYIGKSGTACRAGRQNEGHPQDPDNQNYFTIRNDVKSLEDCQALCDAYPLIGAPDTNCMGVEYRSEGADYADIASRCELWNVPIVATTPQKEYSCYVRDLVRSDYGPSTEFYVGTYKASYADESGDFVTTTMTLSMRSPNELLWTADDGKSWSVFRTDDRNKLKVGPDYPFTGDGFEEPEVFWDADEVAGIVGPSGHTYSTAWAHAKQAHSQSVWQAYIDNHMNETVRVTEAQRQIRELKWAIAEQINTAQAYRDYKNDIGAAYGRTDEANRRIASFIAFVTAEVLKIEVDENVPFVGENNDLELFYGLEFTKNDSRARPGEAGWTGADLFLESVTQPDGSKITNINDGADNAFTPAGRVQKTIGANESQSLRYGGLMFEMDSLPVLSTTDPRNFIYAENTDFQALIDDCNWNGPGDFVPDFESCELLYANPLMVRYFFSNTSVQTNNADYPVINGIFSSYWNGRRTWAGNASTASESLNSTYFTIALADMEYEVPKAETKSITFESDEEIRITYEFTKRTEEQHNEYIAANTLRCDDPVLKPEKLMKRSSVTIDPPGFLIRNETDHTYSVSLNQVGPLYYGEVPPGQIFKRDTAWGHFTIDAKLNLTGEQRYSDWDVAGPIVIFTAQVLHSVFTAGAPISSFKLAIDAAGKKLIASATAKAAASGLSSNIFGRALLRAGVKAIQLATGAGSSNAKIRIAVALGKQAGKTIVMESIDYDTNDAFDDVFARDLAEHTYTKENTEEDRSWSYSGAWPNNVGMYHIVGGPRLPCLTADGEIEIRSSKLEILNDSECAARPDICTLN